MPEVLDRDVRLGALIKESFAGEWGLETPQLGFARSRVVRSTEINDDGSVALKTAVERYIPSEKATSKSLRDGDIVIESAGGSPARPVGRPAIVRIEATSGPIVSSNFVRTLRFDPEQITQGFAIHALRRLYAQPRFGITQQKTTGIINLNFGEFQKLQIWVPAAVDHQALISQILDALDDAILEVDALFEKLRTVRIGMIDDLLTRGIADDGSPRVSSALVETVVGPRPATWKVANLGHFVIGAEYGTNLSLGDSSSGIPVLRMNNIQDGEFDLSDLKFAPAHAVERFRVQRDDVLFKHAFPGAVAELVHLSDGETHALALSDRELKGRKDKLAKFLGDIRAGRFPAEVSSRTCPNCPAFFICGQTPDGPLQKNSPDLTGRPMSLRLDP